MEIVTQQAQTVMIPDRYHVTSVVHKLLVLHDTRAYRWCNCICTVGKCETEGTDC